jgi:tRNA threonylcarbamoyladenosine modification (KEOPS) complex  Pcc1 subunit
MVNPPVNTSSVQTQLYKLTITLHAKNPENRDAVLAALKPEFASIDSKRVALQVKSNQNQIVFHLAAKDVTALRAAATSLVRLYLVADGVHQFTVMKNG